MVSDVTTCGLQHEIISFYTVIHQQVHFYWILSEFSSVWDPHPSDWSPVTPIFSTVAWNATQAEVKTRTIKQDLNYGDKRASHLSCLIKGGSLLPRCHAARQWEDYRAWSDHQLSDERHLDQNCGSRRKIAHADSKYLLPHINTWP